MAAKIADRFLPDPAINKIEEIKINGVVVDPVDKSVDILISESLQLASTSTTDTNALIKHIDGMNDVDSPTDVTITFQPNSTINIPVNKTISYSQIGAGNIITAYEAGVTGDVAQTYRKGDVLTLWHKSLNNWVALNPPTEKTRIQVSKTVTTYTIKNSDVGTVIPCNNVATVITVDGDSISRIGDYIEIEYMGIGTCEISQGTAVLLINANDTLFLDGQYSRVAIQKVSNTDYRVFGQLIPS